LHLVSPWIGPRFAAWASALWLLGELAYEVVKKGRGRAGAALERVVSGGQGIR
jgi:hypothetical protein